MEHPYYLRLRTTKAIPEGEELLLDYGDTYWHDWKPPRARRQRPKNEEPEVSSDSSSSDSSDSHSGNNADHPPPKRRREARQRKGVDGQNDEEVSEDAVMESEKENEDKEEDKEEAVKGSEKEDEEDKEEEEEGNGNSPLEPPGLAQLAEAQEHDNLRVATARQKQRQIRSKRGQQKQTTLGFGSPTRKSARVAAAQSPKN